MCFHTSVITFCCKFAAKMCAVKDWQYRSRELCSIYPIQLPVKAGEKDTGGHILSYDSLR